MTNKSKIGIIGFGNFGKLAASVLSGHFEVFVFEKNKEQIDKAIAKKCGVQLVDFEKTASCDIVILCTPISETENTIKLLIPKMKKGALLLDTCSVKTLPCKWLKDNAPNTIETIGTHPMFGPTTSKFDLEKQTWNLDGLQIVLCPIKIKKNRLNKICKFLSSLKLKVILTTPEEHDKQNAKTLSFVHYIGRCLTASNIGHQEIYTPGYKDLLSILPHTTSDNWTLFYDMNNYNPYSASLREKFIDSCFLLEEKIIQNQKAEEMQKNRQLIDLVDSRILKLIEKRMEYAGNIGKIKKQKNMPIKDEAREEAIIEKLKSKSNLSGEFLKKIYKEIFNESYKKQK